VCVCVCVYVCVTCAFSERAACLPFMMASLYVRNVV
jgi:hypothetical protein